MDIATVVRQLRSERDRAAKDVQRLGAAIAALEGGSNRVRTGKRDLSVSARARIAAAQRARWAKVRASKEASNLSTAPAKRTMSAAARAKIAKALRNRWAKRKKSAQKIAA